MKYLIPCMLLCAFLASAVPCRATTIEWVGTYNNWATSWTAINGLNDGTAGTASIDFVGDTTNPGAFYALNDSYYMFRMQIALDTFTSGSPPNNSYLLMINLPNGKTPDYAITWDAAMNDNTTHGIEMQVFSTGTTTWSSLRFDDIDGTNASKLVNDINGAGGTRTTDGYLRTIDGVSTTNFGTVSYIDFAISKSYLSTYVPALYNGTTNDINDWNIQFGTILNANDHSALNGDVAGGLSLTDTITADGFVAPVPEPGTFMLMGSGLLGLLGYRRRGSLLAYFRR